jgi:hypothetical protein
MKMKIQIYTLFQHTFLTRTYVKLKLVLSPVNKLGHLSDYAADLLL